GDAFSIGFARLGGAVLEPLRFGAHGHVQFQGLQKGATERDADRSWNARIALGMEGETDTVPIFVNPRRLAYLPLLCFAAAIGVLPLPLRRRALCLVCGVPVLLAVALGSVWVTLALIFARVPEVGFAPGPLGERALELAADGLVGQLGLKFALPLV